MSDSKIVSSVLRRTTEAVWKSARVSARSKQTVFETVAMIDRSKQLLSEWPVNGTPALRKIELQLRTPNVEVIPAQAATSPHTRERSPEQVTERDFTNETVSLDGCHFKDCNIENCILEYCGGPVILEGTHFSGCRFSFSGEAAMTVSVLECFGLLDSQNAISLKSSSSAQTARRVN